MKSNVKKRVEYGRVKANHIDGCVGGKSPCQSHTVANVGKQIETIAQTRIVEQGRTDLGENFLRARERNDKSLSKLKFPKSITTHLHTWFQIKLISTISQIIVDGSFQVQNGVSTDDITIDHIAHVLRVGGNGDAVGGGGVEVTIFGSVVGSNLKKRANILLKLGYAFLNTSEGKLGGKRKSNEFKLKKSWKVFPVARSVRKGHRTRLLSHKHTHGMKKKHRKTYDQDGEK